MLMIPLSALPIRFERRRIVPMFLGDEHVSLVGSLVALMESFVNKGVSEDTIGGYIETVVGDYKLAKALYYTLKYFYDVTTKSPFDDVGRRLREDRWKYLKAFYKWVGKKYGYVSSDRRDQVVREFCNEMKINYDFFCKLLESENPFNTILVRRYKDKPKAETVVGLFNFLVIEKLLSISETARIYIHSENLGALAKTIILRAKYHEVVADFRKVGSKLVCEIVGPHQIFKLPAVSEYGRHIAWILAPAIYYADKWFISLSVIYRKRRYSCQFSKSDVKYLLPYWEISPKDKPRDVYDSSVELRVHSVLKTLLKGRGIRILRESDVIILRDGTILIPDFTLVHGDNKVFLEVVGYWRKEYVKKKKEKIGKFLEHDNNLILLIHNKLKSEFDGISVDKVYYDKQIPFGLLYKRILSKFSLHKGN